MALIHDLTEDTRTALRARTEVAVEHVKRHPETATQMANFLYGMVVVLEQVTSAADYDLQSYIQGQADKLAQQGYYATPHV
jgi:hypothetical protein